MEPTSGTIVTTPAPSPPLATKITKSPSVFVQIDLPHPAEAEIEILKDTEGRVLGLKIKPLFACPTDTPTLLYTQVIINGTSAKKGAVRIKGANGGLYYREKTVSSPRFLKEPEA